MSQSDDSYRRGVTCQVSAFEIHQPSNERATPARRWMAIATAHVYDPTHIVPPLSAADTVLAGETMRVFSARTFAPTEAEAMMLAVKALLFQLTAEGFSENRELKMW